MDDNEKQVLEVFRAETTDELAIIEQGLLAMESDRADGAPLDELFRHAHSIKGNAKCLGFESMVALGHVLENQFDLWRSGKSKPNAADIQDALALVDRLRSLNKPAVEPHAPEGPAHAESLSPALPHNEAAEHSKGSGRTLRVSVEKLDDLLNLVGELSISRGRMAAALARRADHEELAEIHQEADRHFLDIQEVVMRARMVPVQNLFRPFVRTVRDLAQECEKQARLEIEAETVEMDNSMIELLRDPVMHLLRNAIDHGIESPTGRKAAGKSPVGTVRLHARHEAGRILVEMSDDGAGIQREAVIARVRELGLHAYPESLEDRQLWSFLAQPGFTTRESANDISGRGVGLDVVRSNVERLRGTLSIESAEGLGTRISLRLPLTLAIIESMLVASGVGMYVIPIEHINECLDIPRGTTDPELAVGWMEIRGEAVPYVRLGRHMSSAHGPTPLRENGVMVRMEDRTVCLIVDALLGEHQAVIKPLTGLLDGQRMLSGATLLGDGRVAWILDLEAVVAMAIEKAGENAPEDGLWKTNREHSGPEPETAPIRKHSA